MSQLLHRLPGSSSLDHLPTAGDEIGDGQLHGWWRVIEWPKGCFTPICTCCWHPPADRWFLSEDAALESRCEREQFTHAD